MTKILKRSLAAFLCLLALSGILPSYITTAKAAGSTQTKTVSITAKLSGVQPTSSFATTKSYDDGEYAGTLYMQDSTYRNVVRATPTVSYAVQSSSKYPNDKSAASQYSFPSTYSSSYYDSMSGQYIPATLTQSGSPYFSGSVTATTLYWTHYGFEYDPVNHTRLGYMSNNTISYYDGLSLFSDSPRYPESYWGPSGEASLGWVQYKAPEWDGALQDSTLEPWRSICIAYHGVARFGDSSTGASNRYRKPVRVFYSRTASTQYIYQNYVGTATVTDTEITYTGVVTLKQADLTVTSLTTDKTDYQAGDVVTVTAVVKNSGITAASGFAVQLSSAPSVTIQNKTLTLAAGASVTVTYTFAVPSNLNSKSITLTVKADANNVIAESNEDNNTRSAVISISASEQDIEVVDSTVTDWYAGKDVTVSATIENMTAEPIPSVPVSLTIGEATYTESISLPGYGSNLAVFRITVPPAGNYTVQITADPECTLGETDRENNTLTRSIRVVDTPKTTLLSPDDTATEQRYRSNGLTDVPAVSSSNVHMWQEVRLFDSGYATKIYYAILTTTFSISPDSRIVYNKPDTMESGFGFSILCKTTLTTNYDHPEKLVGTQIVWVRYPENVYGLLSSRQTVDGDTLEIKSGIVGDLTTLWQLAVNPYSTMGSHLHFIPLWFPDGSYTAWAQAFYAWSPVGQLYDYETDTVTIDGDMYDRITTVKR